MDHHRNASLPAIVNGTYTQDVATGHQAATGVVQRLLAPISPLYNGGFMVAFMQLCLFYYSMAALLQFVLPAFMHLPSIQGPKGRKVGEKRRDAFYSLGPLAVKAAVWTCVEQLHKLKLGFTYAGPMKGTWKEVLYIIASIAVLDLLHDGWFYLTHRLLHWGPLYRSIHYIHHKSKAPSAFTGYSFHILEAVIVFANEIIVCFLFPIHMAVHRIYHTMTTIIHEAGHVGYEVAPFIPTVAGLISLAVNGSAKHSAALNTVQHHDWHHRYPTKHFSLYFTHWDRWFNSLHPNYDAEVVAAPPPQLFGKTGKGKKGVEARPQVMAVADSKDE